MGNIKGNYKRNSRSFAIAQDDNSWGDSAHACYACSPGQYTPMKSKYFQRKSRLPFPFNYCKQDYLRIIFTEAGASH